MIVYFRTYAKEIGCENVKELSDLAVWNYIRDYQRITIWERQEKSGAWVHNHISRGYDADVTAPIPTCNTQEKSWSGTTWRGLEGKLDCYNVVSAV